jgi:hypothetical protein
MGAATTLPGNAGPVRCSRTFLALLLCFQLLHTSLALKVSGTSMCTHAHCLAACASRTKPNNDDAFQLHGVGGYEEKKVPLAVIVPDPSPELSGLSPAPLAAPAPVHGGGDVRPRLPTERWRRDRGEVRRAAHRPHPSPRRRRRLAPPEPPPPGRRRRALATAARRSSRAARPCRSRAASRTPTPSCPCPRPEKRGRWVVCCGARSDISHAGAARCIRIAWFHSIQHPSPFYVHRL